MSHASPYERKKAPGQVRSALLVSTMRIAAAQGLAAVTIEAVARDAGVTKGGLFHHFPSKKALIKGAFEDMIARIDTVLDAAMAKDPYPCGRLTRAYVEAILDRHQTGYDGPLASISLAMLADADLQRRWAHWLRARLEQQSEHDKDVRFQLVRLAADGAWLALLMGEAAMPMDYQSVRTSLLAMSAPLAPRG